MPEPNVLIVDDDATLRGLMRMELSSRGFAIDTAASCAEAIAHLTHNEVDAALLDLRLPDGSGLDVLRWIQEQRPGVEVVVLTGHGSIDSAIEAMRSGAFDYLRKPCPTDELEVTLQRALERKALIERNAVLSDGLAPPDMGTEYVGQSEAFAELIRVINRVAATDSSVLILGETGVGKDVAAKLIHARSDRAKEPLVVVECASLQEELLNSELFGHEKGAYTGAATRKHGLFEVANGGTIFLDEIGDVSPTTQVKLLRVLETGLFRRVGGTQEIQVDVRVLAATNRDLDNMMERGYFRSDLFFRLSTIRVEIPPLRQRPADISVLVQHFLDRLNTRYQQKRRFSAEAMQCLLQHPWPGNIRELLHVVEHAVIMAEQPVIEAEQLPAKLCQQEERTTPALLSLVEIERRHIGRVLDVVDGNRQQAAKILGIGERTLYRKIKEYGLS